MRASSVRVAAVVVGAFWAAACGGGGSGPADGGTDAAADCGAPDDCGVCGDDRDCDDGTFCNGDERCAPESPDADGMGCVPGDPDRCDEGERCDEGADACLAPCDEVADSDGDGHDSVMCGGDDCDDADMGRYPGNAEVCDDDDEDCDPSTFGARNNDGDTAIDDACCNTDESGEEICGTDCNDMLANVNPNSPESCDGVDNDCNGMVDDGVQAELWPDADGDMFGDQDAEPVMGCPSLMPDHATNGDDCNDDPDGGGGINPAATETCNMIDDDCDGMEDEGVGTTCIEDADGDQHTLPGAAEMQVCDACPSGWTAQSQVVGQDCVDTNEIIHESMDEICDRLDNDCSEGGGTVAAEDRDEDGFAPEDGSCVETATSLQKEDCLDDPSIDSDAAMVNPDQTGFFGQGYSTGFTSSWDYNCDDSLETTDNVESCRCNFIFNCPGDGYDPADVSPSNCGSDVTYVDCGAQCSEGPCDRTETEQPLPCR